MLANKKIVVADDDLMIRKAVGEALGQEGCTVFTADSGTAALDACRRHNPDLLVLDINMPEPDGFEVCGRLRATGCQTPILILSARGDETDRVVGFRLGADDYLTKPFSITELVLRVRAILRRSSTAAPLAGENRVVTGDLEMDRGTHRVTVRSLPVELTPREFEMLWLLAVHPGQVFTRDILLERLWDGDPNDHAAVTVYIRRLREKVEVNPGQPLHIKTVWGIGYKYEP